MSHDRLFKKLISLYFYDFLELFAPTLWERIVRSRSPVFLDKESLGKIPGLRRREKDLVVRVHLLDGDQASIIVHLEHEAQNHQNMPERMFMYFRRLLELYDTNQIYPICVFSARARKPRPTEYNIRCHNLNTVTFRYHTIELAHLDWRAFLKKPNPVASALMARMAIRAEDRPRVKAECLRMLANLRVDYDKAVVIGHFVESYLKLNAEEVRTFERILELLPQEEKETVMTYTTSWHREGRKEGRKEGRREGRKEGHLEGRKEASREIALRMRASGVDLHTIADLTGLTICEIESLSDAWNGTCQG
ncbi:MAG: Rpn family recombination-promoting nuclease/putative transposase [Candidatus Eremiobacteraeota bacterium]|nr:Rpn family recombination-promoting nuclease/putative transposase [Candidatus Eremiobacteraeota bacterium]MCW5868781.1 Rpn family recombination-promoting nuclease/putative transposase [Candidatus Eremiobacteraeota bacterium]